MLEILFPNLWFVIWSRFWYFESSRSFTWDSSLLYSPTKSSLIFWTQVYVNFLPRDEKSDRKINSHQKSFPWICENLEEQIAVNSTTASTQWRNSWKGDLQIPGKAHFLLLFAKSICLSASQRPATLFASSKRCLGLAISEQKWLQMKILALALPQPRLFHATPRSISKERRFGQFPRETMAQHKAKGKKWWVRFFNSWTDDRCAQTAISLLALPSSSFQ